MPPDWHEMTRKFWDDVKGRLREKHPHTSNRPQEFIDAYRRELESKGVDLGLVYHRGAEQIAQDIAQQPKPGAFGTPPEEQDLAVV